ncbi:MAG: hypothetical protein MAG715_01307 [Methanonatronarchaeales archaeon]|nr:hypothetical protein [Methanonatronarchaeales archaeon]
MESGPISTGVTPLSSCVVFFDRDRGAAETVAGVLDADLVPYHTGVFEEEWGRDLVVALVATGIVARKIAALLDDKWSDPAVVVVDRALRVAVPLVGGHHGGNDAARRLAEELELVPVVTTGTEARGTWSVERMARELGAEVANRDSTVKTNAAALAPGDPDVRTLPGPAVVLVGQDVTLLRRREDGLSIGVGTRSGVKPEEVVEAVRAVLSDAGLSVEEAELMATGELKRGERGIEEASVQLDLPLLFFDRESLERNEGPSGSRARKLTGWPGVAESAALAASQHRELVVEKRGFDRVTVAVAR